ncbi:hypothetical protein A0J48_011740 [Sphaerospermopsis aphanizomenoides BCCUSP55]|uniref:hypothetical protein n=1 Tax=Sphaerospermopsis aphanizomenoides TaxID=459663 RepID=UPI000AF1BE88|nr:hypothetical protein [Sphaerospermopsis aphanizomenoides]MBK1988202.1 hypothetical protein [Sphaerospermopsis aphanizomenoides BCCUSP55]
MQKLSQLLAFMQQTKLSYLRFLPQGLAFFLVVGLCSCSNGKPTELNFNNFRIGANVTPIREIKPVEDNKATVYIQGKVEKEAPLVKQRGYQIADSTGKIWVVTNQSNLKVGQDAVFKGKIKYKSIPLAGQEYGEVYLEEE